MLSYKEQCDSYTHRLSELVFGSLLASYILGFFVFGMDLTGSLAPVKPLSDLLNSLKLIELLQYLSISLTFSYLTAAYYVAYHNSILTMPQIPSYRLKTDFGIALLQAMLFGLSMIRPDGFLFFVGISLGRVLWRQQDAFKELSEMFHRFGRRTSDSRIDHKSEQSVFKGILQAVNRECSGRLNGWLPPRLGMKFVAAILTLLGAISEFRHYAPPSLKYFLSPTNASLTIAWFQTMIYFIVFGCIWYYSGGVFERGAARPSTEGDEVHSIDDAAERLVEALRNKK